jgi:hypothetical protein
VHWQVLLLLKVLRSGDSVVDKAGQVEQVSSIDNFMRLELFSDERSLRLR